MYITIDIGNSNIVTGFFVDNVCINHWRYQTHRPDISDHYNKQLLSNLQNYDITREEVEGIYIGSVVPAVLKKILKSLHRHKIKIFVIDDNCYQHLPLEIPRPEEIGADLVCNAMAAHDLMKKNITIIDFGTALTCTTIDKKGKILGVSITPGIQVALKSLHTSTAQLPETYLSIPESVLGQDTEHAIQAGVTLGYVGLVKYLIEEIKHEVDERVYTIATGGLANILYPLYKYIDVVEPLLTLKGIYSIGNIVNKQK